LVREQGELDAIIIATGSEVALAVAAAEQLSAAGRGVRVVSMPCTQVFDAQEAGYREAVLPSDILARVAVEAGHADFWYKYVGLDGRVIGMSSFGESAPAPALFEHFGLTADNVVAAVEDVMLD
jgi:transketolase